MAVSCAPSPFDLHAPVQVNFQSEPAPQSWEWVAFDPDDSVDLDEDGDEV